MADRKEDLPLLERHFIERFAVEYRKDIRGITPRGQTLLSRHSWPGNVRELENVLGHACTMCEGDLVDIHDFPETLVSPTHQVKVEDDASVGAPRLVEPGTPEPIEALDAQSKW